MWAEDVHELLELAKTLAVPRARPARARPRDHDLLGRRLGAGRRRGGAAAGSSCPRWPPATRERLRELLPPAATVGNPLDYTAMIWGERRRARRSWSRPSARIRRSTRCSCSTTSRRGSTGAVEESWRAVREGITAGAARQPGRRRSSPRRCPELLDDAAAWRFAQAGIPAVAGLRTGLRCAAAMRDVAGRSRAAAGDRARRAIGARRGAERAGGEARGCPSTTPRRCCARPACRSCEGRLVDRRGRRRRARCVELGGAIVLKLSADVDPAQVRARRGRSSICATEPSVRERVPPRSRALARDARGHVLAERMAEPGRRAARRGADATGWCRRSSLGLGGIWTELLDDVAVVPLPATPERVERALRSLRGAAGARRRARARTRSTSAAAARLARTVGELLLERRAGADRVQSRCSSRPSGALVLDALALAAGRRA